MVACTAETQLGEFLDRQPNPNIVFTDDFGSGLGKWNQVSGTWITAEGSGATGAYLQSPASTAATTFSIKTADLIDLSNRSNCLLEYWVRFDITGNTNTSMRWDFAGSTVTAIKETGTLIAVNSSFAFVKRRVRLPTGITGYLNLVTTMGTATTVDVRVDSLSVRCNETFGSQVTVMSENFESGSANWASGFWSQVASVGQDGSSGYQCQNNNGNGSRFGNYVPNIDLTGRSACKLRYYYQGSLLGSSGNSLSSRWNG